MIYGLKYPAYPGPSLLHIYDQSGINDEDIFWLSVKGLIIGLIVGGMIGGCLVLFLYACIIAGKEADECIEKMTKTQE